MEIHLLESGHPAAIILLKIDTMSDNKKLQGYQDDAKIDIHDRNEVAYIKRKWGYSEGQVAMAMHATKSVGRAKVINWLKENWPRISRA